MIKSLCILTGATLLLSSCGNKKNDDVVATRIVHKLGYNIDPDLWPKKHDPAKVHTTFRNGKTIISSYEDKLLHGDTTTSFEHSQTVQIREHYKRGQLEKRTYYSISGAPEEETYFKSPTHTVVKRWYSSGSPKSTEEFVETKLIHGQYFSINNELASHITNGTGEKTLSNHFGDVIEKQVFVNYEITYTETYHQDGTPHVVSSFKDGKLHGEKKTFSPAGDPISVENYLYGLKHGVCSYYQNGYVYQMTTYVEGRKHGVEQLFIDGVTLAEETLYNFGLKHGPSVVYYDNSANTQWYFQNEKVSKEKFDRYEEREHMISSLQN
jgi:antitoxin component YwqK of YwqJK toxin-antitoxin module